MAYSEELAQRIRDCLEDRVPFEERKMFGGLCFTVHGHMVAGVVDDELMVRVGPDAYEACLKKPHAREMDFTGRPLKGMVYVGVAGIKTKRSLTTWLGRGVEFVGSLPPKKPKKPRPRKRKAPARRPPVSTR